MALGDLVTADYMFEFNNLAIGATTDYDLLSVANLLGHDVRTTTVNRFGRHGGSAGRHYANFKQPIFAGKFSATTDTDFRTKRQAMAAAFAVIVGSENSIPLVFRLPDSVATKVQALVRPTGLEIPLSREHALKYAPFVIRFEMVNPIIKALTATNTVFSVPTDTESITNNGNAPATWTASLVGPAEDPILTHNGTGQILSFTSLTLSGSETLVYNSFDNSIKVNGVSVSTSLAVGFSWFDIDPGTNSITFTATNAGTASFTLTHNDAYWSV